MPRYKDLSGKRFGKLVVTEKQPSVAHGQHALWKCQCDCGNTAIVSSHP